MPILNHNGSAYLPARSIAKLFNVHVDYDEETQTIRYLDPNIKFGPLVSRDQAKLVAYETYEVKRIHDISIRLLTDSEWEKVPETAKKFTPVY